MIPNETLNKITELTALPMTANNYLTEAILSLDVGKVATAVCQVQIAKERLQQLRVRLLELKEELEKEGPTVGVEAPLLPPQLGPQLKQYQRKGH